MHTRRRFCVSPVATAEELARMLTERTWTLCSGFSVEGHPAYLFLNDATHEDGAAEFACVKILGSSQWLQIESITFSWCDESKAREYVRATLAGEYDNNDFARVVDLQNRLDTPQEHGRCPSCA